MKRITLLILSIFIVITTFAQGIPISQLPTYSGNPLGGWVPIVVGGATKKIDGSLFGYKHFDSVAFAYGLTVDTFHFYNTVSGTSYTTLYVKSGSGGLAALFAKAPIHISGLDTVTVDTSTALIGLTTLYRSSLKVNYTDTGSMLANYLRTITALTTFYKAIDTVSTLATQNYVNNHSSSGTDSGIVVGSGITKGVAGTTITLKGDTSLLATQYDNGLKVNKMDTASMLSTYARSNAVVKYTDTSGMLLPYLRKIDTASMLSNYARSISVVKYTDTSAMLTNYARSIAIVKYTDTAAMLSTYLRSILGMKYTDSASMLSPYQRSITAMKYTDTAAMLLPYKNKVDSIWRTVGKDSLQFTINGRYHSILDSASTGGGGGTDSSVNVSFGLIKGVSSTNITITADSTALITKFNSFKNSNAGDTLWRIVYGIPRPTATNSSTSNGTPITWLWLTSGGGHSQSVDLDSCIFVNSSGHLLIGFPTAQAVAGAALEGDEQTYPIKMGIIGNFDNYEFIGNLASTGGGINLVGNGTSTLAVQNSQTGLYTITLDTVNAAGWALSFDYTDGAGMYLGPTSSGLLAQYTGSNGYTLNRLYSGLTRAFKYQVLDCAGNPVTGAPTSADRFTIFDGAAQWNGIDFRQFLTSTNPYLVAGLPNFWFMGLYKAYPDSLKIIRPLNFTVIASGTAGQINVTWNAVANAANGYELDRSTNPNFSGGVTVLVNFTSATSFNDTGLTTGTVYYYRLRASRVANVYSGWELRFATAP